jgi:hypothetical protein
MRGPCASLSVPFLQSRENLGGMASVADREAETNREKQSGYAEITALFFPQQGPQLPTPAMELGMHSSPVWESHKGRTKSSISGISELIIKHTIIKKKMPQTYNSINYIKIKDNKYSNFITFSSSVFYYYLCF